MDERVFDPGDCSFNSLFVNSWRSFCMFVGHIGCHNYIDVVVGFVDLSGFIGSKRAICFSLLERKDEA